MLRTLTPLPARLARATHPFTTSLPSTTPPSTTTTTITTASPEDSLISLGRSIFLASHRAQVTFLVGGPGSGKGTLSAMACERLGYQHVSVGELLRAEIQSGTTLGARIAPLVNTGHMVPSSVSVPLVLAHLEHALLKRGARDHDDGAAHDMQWIVDGFPRKVSSAHMWESLGFQPKRVVALQVGEEEMKRRLGMRGRVDDVPLVVRQRLERHWSEWPSLTHFYRERGLLTVIDASATPEEVWKRFLAAVAAA